MANWFTMPLNIMTEEHQEMIAASYDVEVSELEERKYSIKLETTELSTEEIIYLGDNGDIVICNDCGAIIATLTNNYAIIYGDDGEISHEVCLSCLNNARYGQCEETGFYFNRRNLITLNPDTSREMIVFSGCERAEEAYVCDDCGERFDDYYINRDGYDMYLCDNCLNDNWISCEDCGRFVRSDDYYYSNGRYYCRNCYEELDEDEDEDDDDDYDENYEFQYIDRYHHDNRQDSLCFRKCENEISDEYLGVELEVEANDEPLRRELDERAHNIKDVVPWFFMIKYDGSLNKDFSSGANHMDGFEMVTDPCTIRYHLEKFPWERICETAIADGMRSDKARNCGLHIHVSRKSLGETEEEQDMTAAKLIILFERFEKEIECFARRRSERWAKFYKFKSKKEDFGEVAKEMYDSLSNKCGDSHSQCRYHAINLTNTHTVEFRVFKGSLNVETIKATIEFIHEIVNFAKASNLIKIQNCVWTDICHNTEYEELRSYLKRRNLFWAGGNSCVDSDGTEQ